MPQQLEIAYRASGARMHVDLDLHVGLDGHAELFLGSSYSIPLQRVSCVGEFGGPAPDAEMAALSALLDDADLTALGGQYGQPTPDTPLRYLAITASGHTAELHLTGMTTNEAIDGLEQALQRLALVLTSQPLRVLDASLALRESAGRLTATIELRSAGAEPVTVLFVEPSQPGMALRAEVALEGQMALLSGATMPTPLANVSLPRDAVDALVRDGELPSGMATLAPGSGYRLEFPPTDVPEAAVPVTVTGTVQLWWPDKSSRRGLTLVTSRAPLP